MGASWVLVLVAVLPEFAIVAVVVAYRGRIQDRMFPGTGLREWRGVSRGLPWRDRWSLYLSASLGRAVSPRLAPLAVRKGEVMLAVGERTVERRSASARIYLAIGLLGLLDLVLQLTDLASGDRGTSAWVSLVAAVLMTFIGFAFRPLTRWQMRLVERSVRRNQALGGA